MHITLRYAVTRTTESVVQMATRAMGLQSAFCCTVLSGCINSSGKEWEGEIDLAIVPVREVRVGPQAPCQW